MKIIIESPTEEIPEKVFDYFIEKCKDALQEFTIEIEGTKLKYHYKWERTNENA